MKKLLAIVSCLCFISGVSFADVFAEGTANGASRKFELKTEAEFRGYSTYGWVSGFDTNFNRDVYSALSGRLGRTVPTD